MLMLMPVPPHSTARGRTQRRAQARCGFLRQAKLGSRGARMGGQFVAACAEQTVKGRNSQPSSLTTECQLQTDAASKFRIGPAPCRTRELTRAPSRRTTAEPIRPRPAKGPELRDHRATSGSKAPWPSTQIVDLGLHPGW